MKVPTHISISLGSNYYTKLPYLAFLETMRVLFLGTRKLEEINNFCTSEAEDAILFGRYFKKIYEE